MIKYWTPRGVLVALVGGALGVLLELVPAVAIAQAGLTPAATVRIAHSAIAHADVPHLQHIRVLTTPPFADCKKVAGCTDVGRGKWIYVSPRQSPLQVRLTALHEAGHRWDDYRYWPGLRARLKVALGWRLPSDVYWLDLNSDDPPNEQASEAYAWCGLGRRPWPNEPVAYRYRPTLAEYERTCALIRESAAWYSHLAALHGHKPWDWRPILKATVALPIR